MTQISSKLKLALRQRNIMPPSSSKRASRSTPNGSQERRTMLPTPSLVILIVQLVNSPKSSANLPLSASKAFSNSTATQQNQLVADCIAAETSRARAVARSTHENHAWSWHRFTKYLGSIGIGHNAFLDSITQAQ